MPASSEPDQLDAGFGPDAEAVADQMAAILARPETEE